MHMLVQHYFCGIISVFEALRNSKSKSFYSSKANKVRLNKKICYINIAEFKLKGQTGNGWFFQVLYSENIG